MSTTRHLINRQRRLAAAAAPAATAAKPAAARPAAPDRPHPRPRTRRPLVALPEPAAAPRTPGFVPALARTAVRVLRRPAVLAALLGVATVLLGGFAAFATHKAAGLRDTAATGNAALTDTAATAQVKGAATADIDAVFSYDYADPARTAAAVRKDLTGKAVQQYATLLAPVRAQAPKQKLVLTTTVTQTGVEAITGDRARVLVFADQRNTSTAGSGRTSYAAAMFAVDLVRHGGGWLIASIDTFG